jgi:hypothetical protein
MTPAQQAALRRAVEADGPVKIAPASAAVLCERYAYIEAAPGGWIATAKGRSLLAGMDYETRYRERCAEIPHDSNDWAKRVMAWLGCHGYVGGMARYGKYHRVQQYAEHYAACLHAGLEPVRPDGDLDWMDHDVEMAVGCLRDFDKAQEAAAARDCGVDVIYRTAPSHPKAKPEAATPRPDGTVDLRAYRLKRGSDTDRGGAA